MEPAPLAWIPQEEISANNVPASLASSMLEMPTAQFVLKLVSPVILHHPVSPAMPLNLET